MPLSHAVRSVVLGMPFLFRGTPRERAGSERLASRRLGAFGAARLAVESPAFRPGGRIPAQFTPDGENIAPPLRWSGVPDDARSLVLLVEDPDAPTIEPFVHWLVLLRPDVSELPAAPDAFLREGRATPLTSHWVGFAPPRGDVEHHYHFQLFALDDVPDLARHPGRRALLRAMKDHVLAFGETVGTYQR